MYIILQWMGFSYSKCLDFTLKICMCVSSMFMHISLSEPKTTQLFTEPILTKKRTFALGLVLLWPERQYLCPFGTPLFMLQWSAQLDFPPCSRYASVIARPVWLATFPQSHCLMVKSKLYSTIIIFPKRIMVITFGIKLWHVSRHWNCRTTSWRNQSDYSMSYSQSQPIWRSM